MTDIYIVDFLKSARDENDILTSVLLLHENNKQGDQWMMEGDRDPIGDGQGK